MPPYLDPTNQAFIDAGAKAGGPALYERSYVDARAVLETIQKHELASDVKIEEIELPVGPSGKVRTTIFKPADASGKLPTGFYTHGGGWVLGSPNTHGRLVSDIVRESGCAIVFPYYTPSPEGHFPIHFEECYAVLEHIAKNGGELGLKTDKIVLLGDSAGGQSAVAMAQLAIQRSLPAKIVYQVLLYPCTDLSRTDWDTYKEFHDGPYLSVPLLEWMFNAFCPKESDRKNPLVSPNLLEKDVLKLLPPTLIVTAGVDPLRRQGEEFGEKLQWAGVETAILRAHGQIHDWVMLNGTATSAASVATIELVGLKLRKWLT